MHARSVAIVNWQILFATLPWLTMLLLAIFVVTELSRLEKRIYQMGRIIDVQSETLESHAKILRGLKIEFSRFTSVEAISEEMELTADIIEARLAGRQTLPRPGSEPHARISKLKDRKGNSGWDKAKK